VASGMGAWSGRGVTAHPKFWTVKKCSSRNAKGLKVVYSTLWNTHRTAIKNFSTTKIKLWRNVGQTAFQLQDMMIENDRI